MARLSFGGGSEITLDNLENWMETAGMVTRWKEANPELVGTDKDVMKKFIEELKEVLGAEQEKFSTGSGIAILLFKKAN